MYGFASEDTPVPRGRCEVECGTQADQHEAELRRRVDVHEGRSGDRPTANMSPDLTGWLWTGLIERISLDRRSWR
jgi:hypothetical protein